LVIGVLTIYRQEVRPFTEKQIELVKAENTGRETTSAPIRRTAMQILRLIMKGPPKK
jgi:hypothetical protein